MFHLLRKRRSKRANKKSQGSRVAKVSPVGSMEGESSPKDPAYLAKRRVWKLEHKLDLPRVVAEDLAAAVGPDADKPADIVVLADDCEAMHALRCAGSTRGAPGTPPASRAAAAPLLRTEGTRGSSERSSAASSPGTGALRICTTCRTRHRRRGVVSFKHCLFVS